MGKIPELHPGGKDCAPRLTILSLDLGLFLMPGSQASSHPLQHALINILELVKRRSGLLHLGGDFAVSLLAPKGLGTKLASFEVCS